jgi:hypothetical protein
MIIDNINKKIFVHIPKNAGMTIRHSPFLKDRILINGAHTHKSQEYTNKLLETMKAIGDHHGIEHARWIDLKEKYTKGGFGYGHAKTELLNYILSNFSSEREKFDYYMSNKEELEAVLKTGSEKADKVAQKVLSRVREKLGYN